MERLGVARTAGLAAIVVVGMWIFWQAFKPGFMSFDSLDQFRQAISGKYHDGHPPIMAWVWSKLLPIRRGPEPMLFLQLALLWSSTALLVAIGWRRGFKWAPVLCAFAFLPWVASLAGVIWKDVAMAFSWLLAVMLMLNAPAGRARWYWLLPALLLLFYGMAVRLNAWPALPPLAYWWWTLAMPHRSPRLQGLLVLLLMAACMLLIKGFDRYVAEARTTNMRMVSMYDDLHRLSTLAGRNLFPPHTGVTDAMQAKCRDIVVSVVECFVNDGWPRWKHTPEYFDPLNAAWRGALLDNPGGYLAYRWEAYQELLRGPDRPPYYIWHQGVDDNELGIRQTDSSATRAFRTTVEWVADIFPFAMKPYFWLVIAIVGTLAGVLSPRVPFAVVALCASATIYCGTYFPFTPIGDFRYAYWVAVATSLALVIFAIERRHPRQSR